MPQVKTNPAKTGPGSSYVLKSYGGLTIKKCGFIIQNVASNMIQLSNVDWNVTRIPNPICANLALNPDWPTRMASQGNVYEDSPD